MSEGSTEFDFRAAMLRRQERLLASLSEGREVQTHPTASGDHSELDWRGALTEFLPSRYRVSQGQVVDAAGSRSEAIDLIVHDAQYTPIIFQRPDADGQGLIVPAESVYAVLEAKPTLNKAYLEYAAKKVASVRSLARTSYRVIHAGGVINDPKPPPPIIGGIVSDSCDWSPCLGEPFESALRPATPLEHVDIGCALDGGAFDATFDGQEIVSIDRAEPGLTLMFFLVRLFHRLQALGTAPAIDIRAYARDVWPSDDPSRST